MKFGADIHGTQRMNPKGVGYPHTFYLRLPQRRLNFNISPA